MKQIDPVLLDQIVQTLQYLAAAAIGWIAKLLSQKKPKT